ncbi:hypothetical protein NP493_1504g00003 [Ridgeia piscesae]|uniref:Neurotransmitter-gated ion-channel transmembrane domain-containing protein n=1 Tax=Ridgeia piscesae TaxID=27915 RepID=A0AAD9K0K2_RIDPI|nr:hypothetical protein NP493_1504g00003 [Ridgeia piscesae]
MAWLSFWVNMDSASARVALGLTTVLTMAAQLSGSKANIPQVHYPKAIDVWMATCMVFVFAAMVKYAFVNSLSRESPKNEKKKQHEENDNVKNCSHTKCVGPFVFEPQLKSPPRSGRDSAIFLDRVSQICFPIAFVVFNVVYWSVYLRILSPCIYGRMNTSCVIDGDTTRYRRRRHSL